MGFLLQSKNIQSRESLISWDLDSPLGANFKETRIIYQLRQGNVGEWRNALGVSQNRFTLFSALTWGFPDMAIHQLDGGNGHVCKVIEEEIPYNRAQGSWWPPWWSTPSEQFYIGPVPSLVEWSHDAPFYTDLGLFYPLCNLSLVFLCPSSYP